MEEKALVFGQSYSNPVECTDMHFIDQFYDHEKSSSMSVHFPYNIYTLCLISYLFSLTA
jgi:hypothetical protein